jgi:hypothetical protein
MTRLSKISQIWIFGLKTYHLATLVGHRSLNIKFSTSAATDFPTKRRKKKNAAATILEKRKGLLGRSALLGAGFLLLNNFFYPRFY